MGPTRGQGRLRSERCSNALRSAGKQIRMAGRGRDNVVLSSCGVPTLRPPSQEYIDSYGRLQGASYRTPPPRAVGACACAKSGSSSGSLGSPRFLSTTVAEPEAPRLFDGPASRPEPTDYSLFYPALPSKGYLRHPPAHQLVHAHPSSLPLLPLSIPDPHVRR